MFVRLWMVQAAYLWIRATHAGCEASCCADARAAAAPCARATVERGLWLALPLVKVLPLPVAVLWLAEGLKWAASARIILITDFRLPSTMSVDRSNIQFVLHQLTKHVQYLQHTVLTWLYCINITETMSQCFFILHRINQTKQIKMTAEKNYSKSLWHVDLQIK